MTGGEAAAVDDMARGMRLRCRRAEAAVLRRATGEKADEVLDAAASVDRTSTALLILPSSIKNESNSYEPIDGRRPDSILRTYRYVVRTVRICGVWPVGGLLSLINCFDCSFIIAGDRLQYKPQGTREQRTLLLNKSVSALVSV